VVEHDGHSYHASEYREHEPGDPPEIRRARVRASLVNDTSCWLTPESTFALLERAGFATVLQCHLPSQPLAGADRLTLVALKGGAPDVVSFPWINTASAAEVERRIRAGAALPFVPPSGSARQDTVTDVVVTLGAWVRAHPGFALGTDESAMRLAAPSRIAGAGIWRRHDLAARIGGLGRIPPLLAVEVAAAGETEDMLLDKVRWYLELGVATVWLALPEEMRVVVATPGRRDSFGAGMTLPEPTGLPGLAPGVGEIFHQAIAGSRLE
jgi:hypothetical protein